MKTSKEQVLPRYQFLFGTSPYYRWHVDLQDMTIFRKAVNKSKADAYNFMLICVDYFSNYFMVELIKNKHAVMVLNAMVKIIQREKSIPILIYCDRGSEFNNKLFNDPRTNGFKVQYTIDCRKVVYVERAIRTIRRSLEQYYTIRPNEDIKTAIKKVVKSHNNALSRQNPVGSGKIHTSPHEILDNPSLIDDMEAKLRTQQLRQYTTNIDKKVINPKPKFKKGDFLVQYMLQKEQFSKESSLSGSWSKKIYSIYRVNKAHSFKPMNMYLLSEIGKDSPTKDLLAIQENLLKEAIYTKRDKFLIKKILKKRKNHVLIKWLNYNVPTWEPRSAIIQ